MGKNRLEISVIILNIILEFVSKDKGIVGFDHNPRNMRLRTWIISVGGPGSYCSSFKYSCG